MLEEKLGDLNRSLFRNDLDIDTYVANAIYNAFVAQAQENEDLKKRISKLEESLKSGQENS